MARDLPATLLVECRVGGGGAGNRLPRTCCPGTWRCRWISLLWCPFECIYIAARMLAEIQSGVVVLVNKRLVSFWNYKSTYDAAIFACDWDVICSAAQVECVFTGAQCYAVMLCYNVTIFGYKRSIDILNEWIINTSKLIKLKCKRWFLTIGRILTG